MAVHLTHELHARETVPWHVLDEAYQIDPILAPEGTCTNTYARTRWTAKDTYHPKRRTRVQPHEPTHAFKNRRGRTCSPLYLTTLSQHKICSALLFSRKENGGLLPRRGSGTGEADGDGNLAARDRHRRHPGVRPYKPDPPAPVRVPLLRGRHDAAGGGAPLLRAPERGRAAVPHLRRARGRRPPHRPRVPRHRGALPHPARRREAALALARVRGERRRALHAGRARGRRAPGPREGGQDVRQDRAFLAGGSWRRAPAWSPPDHDGAHPGGPAPAGPRRVCGEEVRRVLREGEGEPGVHERAGARHPPAGQRCWKGVEDGYPRGGSQGRGD